MQQQQQQELERITLSIGQIQQKALDIKQTLIQLLMMFDMQEQASWPELLDKFSSLASAMSQLQTALRKSGLPSGVEDAGSLLRSHTLVPNRLSLENDTILQQTTEGRISAWTHDVLPNYLRTKTDPSIEQDEDTLLVEIRQKSSDAWMKQIQNLNKHVDQLTSQLAETSHMTSERIDQRTYNDQETIQLVRAVMTGDQLRQNPIQQQSIMIPTGSSMPIVPMMSGSGKTTSGTNRTGTKAATGSASFSIQR